MSAPLLAVEGLTVAYGKASALRDIGFALEPGEVRALLGANGAGKSTLLKSLIGLVPAQSGRILLDGRDIAGLSVEARVRSGVGYAPEGRRIFPGMTVHENLAVASSAPRGEREKRIAGIYALFPALAEKGRINAWQLSGGQQQMLAIGRALIAGSRLLLLDELSLGLAPIVSRDLLASLRRIAAAGTAILFAEQNVPTAMAVADRVLVLRTGTVVADAAAGAIRPEDIIERSFLGA